MTLLPPKLSRYSAVATLLLKYGRSRLVAEQRRLLTSLAPDGAIEPEEADPAPEELANDLERLCSSSSDRCSPLVPICYPSRISMP